MSHVFIGSCRRCKLTRRFTATVVKEVEIQLGRYPHYYKRKERTLDITAAAPFTGRELFTGGKPSGHETTAVEPADRPGAIWLLCPVGHSVEFKRIAGRKNAVPCSKKCVSSTGHVCECACGGANHGGAHA